MGLQKFRHDLATKATSQNTISCKVIINIMNRTVSFLKILNVLKEMCRSFVQVILCIIFHSLMSSIFIEL